MWSPPLPFLHHQWHQSLCGGSAAAAVQCTAAEKTKQNLTITSSASSEATLGNQHRVGVAHESGAGQRLLANTQKKKDKRQKTNTHFRSPITRTAAAAAAAAAHYATKASVASVVNLCSSKCATTRDEEWTFLSPTHFSSRKFTFSSTRFVEDFSLPRRSFVLLRKRERTKKRILLDSIQNKWNDRQGCAQEHKSVLSSSRCYQI